jgi:hypothetical protein
MRYLPILLRGKTERRLPVRVLTCVLLLQQLRSPFPFPAPASRPAGSTIATCPACLLREPSLLVDRSVLPSVQQPVRPHRRQARVATRARCCISVYAGSLYGIEVGWVTATAAVGARE